MYTTASTTRRSISPTLSTAVATFCSRCNPCQSADSLAHSYYPHHLYIKRDQKRERLVAILTNMHNVYSHFLHGLSTHSHTHIQLLSPLLALMNNHTGSWQMHSVFSRIYNIAHSRFLRGHSISRVNV